MAYSADKTLPVGWKTPTIVPQPGFEPQTSSHSAWPRVGKSQTIAHDDPCLNHSRLQWLSYVLPLLTYILILVRSLDNLYMIDLMMVSWHPNGTRWIMIFWSKKWQLTVFLWLRWLHTPNSAFMKDSDQIDGKKRACWGILMVNSTRNDTNLRWLEYQNTYLSPLRPFFYAILHSILVDLSSIMVVWGRPPVFQSSNSSGQLITKPVWFTSELVQFGL